MLTAATSPAAVTDTERALLGVGIAAIASLVAVLLTGATAYLATRRDRRRNLYGEAFKAALGWHEMIYRVRRRQQDDSPELIKRMHDLQEQLTYYQGWIGSESRYMERSYQRLVEAVKTGTKDHITTAWNDPIRPIPGNALPTDANPQFKDEAQAFLSDVRGHLSPQPWRRLAVAWRNWSDP